MSSKKETTRTRQVVAVVIVALVVLVAALALFIRSDSPLAQRWAAKLGGVMPATLEGTAWVWERTELRDGSVIEAPAGAFILSFIAEEGRFASTTDCNTLMGSYLASGGKLRFGDPASTMMFCERSLESVYTQELALVNSYSVRGGTLRLDMDRDFGVMVFGKKR